MDRGVVVSTQLASGLPAHLPVQVAVYSRIRCPTSLLGILVQVVASVKHLFQPWISSTAPSPEISLSQQKKTGVQFVVLQVLSQQQI